MSQRTAIERRTFLQVNAARMRIAPTPAEKKLRPLLESMGFKFQVPIEVRKHRSYKTLDGSIMDFYHAGKKLCIELDGGYHKPGPDGRRDRRLAAVGIRTIRFKNREALNETARVIAQIQEALNGHDL